MAESSTIKAVEEMKLAAEHLAATARGGVETVQGIAAQKAQDLRKVAGAAAKEIAETASEQIKELGKVAAEQSVELREVAQAALHDASVKAQHYTREGRTYVQANPLKAAFICIGAGFLLGWFFRK